MPEGGDLTIRIDEIELDETAAATLAEGKPGQYARLSVTDTGTGIDEKTRAKLFEPFFTTKEQGKGTGLGLSIVYGIVKQSGGYITVTSEPGRGATFQIYLPIAVSPALVPLTA
jgi:signal transduction histidine kinase